MAQKTLTELAKVLRLFACNAFDGAMSSSAGKFGHDLYLRMKRPQIGDLVVEWSTAFQCNSDDHINAVGKLLWHEGDSYKIETLDGRVERWNNAMFIAVVESV